MFTLSIEDKMLQKDNQRLMSHICYSHQKLLALKLLVLKALLAFNTLNNNQHMEQANSTQEVPSNMDNNSTQRKMQDRNPKDLANQMYLCTHNRLLARLHQNIKSRVWDLRNKVQALSNSTNKNLICHLARLDEQSYFESLRQKLIYNDFSIL